MKSSPRTTRRHGDGHGGAAAAAGGFELSDDRLVIRLPDPLLLLLLARSVFLAATLLSFPLLRAALLSGGAGGAAAAAADAAASGPTAAAAAVRPSRLVEDAFFLPMLLRDLRREGLFPPHSRGVFLSGGAPYRLHLLHRYELKPISSASELMVADRSIDFVLAADGFCNASSFAFVERVLRIGGITTVRLSSDPNYFLHLPPNYKMVYIRRFGSTFVAIKKTAHSATNAYISGTRRRLLAVPEAKKEALKGLEDVVLEPPPERRKLQKLYKNTRFLPDLIDTSLSEYPRRLFVDVGESKMGETEKWFEKHYPARNFKFEIIRLDFAGRGKKRNAAGFQGISEWMGRNVNEEDYVVMKAEAEAAEEMLSGKAIKLVDELFLECKHQWQKGRMSSTGRAYWECLALYGKLRDEGVAVHQWWG